MGKEIEQESAPRASANLVTSMSRVTRLPDGTQHKTASLQHQVFPGRLRSEYYPGPILLDGGRSDGIPYFQDGLAVDTRYWQQAQSSLALQP
jgi:hypothetical protein